MIFSIFMMIFQIEKSNSSVSCMSRCGIINYLVNNELVLIKDIWVSYFISVYLYVKVIYLK